MAGWLGLPKHRPEETSVKPKQQVGRSSAVNCAARGIAARRIFCRRRVSWVTHPAAKIWHNSLSKIR
jgi:hypothetical protein